jgi:cytochrome P450
VAAAVDSLDELRLDDPSFYGGDPYPTYARLRREAPVYHDAHTGLWAVSTYDDVRYVSSTPELFSAAGGTALAFAAGERSRAIRTTANTAYPIGEQLLNTDPPRHTRLRRLISRAFTPRVVAQLEERIREVAAECVGRIDAHEVVDLVELVSAPVPLTVIADLLGVPAADREDFRRWSDHAFDVDVRPGDPGWDDVATAFIEMSAYFAEHVDQRRRNPGDDLISALLAAELDGDTLTFGTVFEFCRTLLAAGNDTTRCLISGGALALAERPDQWARLRGDPALVANAVEEMLRYVTPIHTFIRTTTRATELRGRSIEAGERVVLLYASANRDESVWRDPDAFEVDRVFSREQMALGWGPHHCLGASVARLEGRVVFEALVRRFAFCELAGEPERYATTLASNYRRLPLLFHEAA